MTERAKRNITAVLIALTIAAFLVVWFSTIGVSESTSEPVQLIVSPSMTCAFTWTDADGDVLGSDCEVPA